MDETTRTMKVGEVAEAAGLTVRTLHHWDRIGLLSPSERSPAGHRVYTEADLVRLYQVLALRNLGLSLESIAVCLDAGVDPVRLVRDHLAQVEAAAAELERRRAKLRRLAEDRAAGTAPDAPEVRRLVARMDGLATQFSGGDQELSAGVRAAWHDDPAGLADVPAGQADSWRALSEYLDLARRHTHSKEQKHV